MLLNMAGAAGWRGRARPSDGSIRDSPWETDLYAVYKLPKAKASRKKCFCTHAELELLVSGAKGGRCCNRRDAPTSSGYANFFRHNVFYNKPTRITCRDEILTNFLTFPLAKISKSCHLRTSSQKGRPLLRIKIKVAFRQCRPLDGLGCMWASLSNVSY